MIKNYNCVFFRNQFELLQTAKQFYSQVECRIGSNTFNEAIAFTFNMNMYLKTVIELMYQIFHRG